MDPVRSKKSEISADLPEASRTSNGMDKDKVLDLAKLARIELNGEEAESLSREFGTILDYVREVKGAEIKNRESERIDESEFPLRNVLRKDVEPHQAGLYSKELLEQAPAKEGDYIKVKKIL